MQVKELNKEQLTQLKINYYMLHNDLHISYSDILNIDELVTDEQVYNFYDGIVFVDDDFWS